MHNIEPFFNWRHLYTAEEDPQSPFFGRTYSEFEFTQVIYNYYIHPQWDDFGSRTLYLKILFVDYDEQFAIVELMGEWNDAIENDIMELKREIVDQLSKKGICKYILICENVLNFHSSDKEYYQEWYEMAGWLPSICRNKHSRILNKKNYIIISSSCKLTIGENLHQPIYLKK
jgi:hypothetical protein